MNNNIKSVNLGYHANNYQTSFRGKLGGKVGGKCGKAQNVLTQEVFTKGDCLDKDAQSLRLPFAKKISSAFAKVFGYQLVFDEITKKMTSIKKYHKGDLQFIKVFSSTSGKLKEIDEYSNGKLVKMYGYSDDGKTLKWTVEYINSGSDNEVMVTKTFYKDGIIPEEEIVENESSKIIKRRNPDASVKSISEYENDVLLTEKEYSDDCSSITEYKDGVIHRKMLKYKLKDGSEHLRKIKYDESGKPLGEINYYDEIGLVPKNKIKYNKNGQNLVTQYDKDGNILGRYILDTKTNKKIKLQTIKEILEKKQKTNKS